MPSGMRASVESKRYEEGTMAEHPDPGPGAAEPSEDEARPRSFWIDTTPATTHPRLEHDISVDVAVVGGGIVGVTTAYLLTQAGARVALVEAARVATGVSGHTTAKVTSLHGLIYHDLVERAGEGRARLYGEANQAAVGWIADTVAERGIECDLVRAPAYTVATGDEAAERVHEEAETAARLGLPADVTDHTELPFPVRAAVCFREQAGFHPRKYLLALAEEVIAGGGQVFEQTRALHVDEGNPCRLQTSGGTVTADWVVLANLMPFPRFTQLWGWTYPDGHAAMALQIDGPAPEGMYLVVDAQPHSVRTHPTDGGPILILDSPGQKPGHGSTLRLYRDMLAEARAVLPVSHVRNRWWTMDFMSADRIPCVGGLNPLSKRVLAATGMSAWGMTNGTAAAHVLADRIGGRPNEWSKLYDPARLPLSRPTLVTLAKESADAVGRHLIPPRFGHSPAFLGSVEPGGGTIVKAGGRNVAASRDETGRLSAVSPYCTHVGCELRWNDLETTWDCPCHGSRFHKDGTMLQGPAVKDLEQIGVETEVDGPDKAF